MKRRILQEYLGFFVMLGVCFVVLGLSPIMGKRVFQVAFRNTLFMLSVVPPIFLLVGLFDAWIPKERVIKHLGDASGLVGTAISLALGAFTAGPLYAAFPVAEVLLKKGVSLRNVWIFLGAWSTMKIPMLLFELKNLGTPFALSRYGMSFLGVLGIAWVLERVIDKEEQRLIRLPFLKE
ncbi:MAG: permease [Candidatus Caldatribacteriaceae bacterium]